MYFKKTIRYQFETIIKEHFKEFFLVFSFVLNLSSNRFSLSPLPPFKPYFTTKGLTETIFPNFPKVEKNTKNTKKNKKSKNNEKTNLKTKKRKYKTKTKIRKNRKKKRKKKKIN